MPTAVAANILSATDRGRVAPSLLLLSLRPVPLVMEEIAWCRRCTRTRRGRLDPGS